jgi:hypothetical protein
MLSPVSYWNHQEQVVMTRRRMQTRQPEIQARVTKSNSFIVNNKELDFPRHSRGRTHRCWTLTTLPVYTAMTEVTHMSHHMTLYQFRQLQHSHKQLDGRECVFINRNSVLGYELIFATLYDRSSRRHEV